MALLTFHTSRIVVLVVLFIAVQSMYTGQSAGTPGSRRNRTDPNSGQSTNTMSQGAPPSQYSLFLQRQMMQNSMQNMYNRPQPVRQNAFRFSPWFFLMDGFDMGM